MADRNPNAASSQSRFTLSFKGVKDAATLPLLSKVRRTISKHGLLQKSDRVVVALSGGMDSMTLLHLLLSLKGEIGLSLYIAHLDHMFRGEASRRDADLVGQLAQELDLPATIRSVDVPRLRLDGKLSPQEAARQARYGFLLEVAALEGADRIALGHHLDDQAETVLINLLRGSGSRGLGGIPIKRGPFIRPLLEVSRREIEEHVHASRLPFLEDPSNREGGYLRNRIRFDLLPYLARAFNPRIREALAETADLLREDDTFLSRLAQEALAPLVLAHRERGLELSRPGLRELPCSLRRRVLREAVGMVRGGIYLLGGRRLAALEDLALFGRAGAGLHLGEEVVAAVEYEALVLRGEETGTERAEAFPLTIPGRTYVPTFGREVVTNVVKNQSWDFRAVARDVAFLDMAKVRPPLSLRSRETGDRFYPLGVGGQKKLQDFFVDAKVPRYERDRTPILVDSEKILWVVGLRIDERAKVRADTEQVLVVEARRVPHGV
ncbi:MAG: tRNA lysidine(34) synthetase TilS [candidate division NC10 bacterium]|nr:tRNA lysidine(34) synthetase TilS [candidate division NC10 bacterium]